MAFWREFITKSWALPLASLKMIALVYHAFDCSTCINVIPNHIAEINCMPQSALGHFRKGAFVTSLKGNAWSSVALDESHEMSINKDVKGAISNSLMITYHEQHHIYHIGLDHWKVFVDRYFFKKIQPNS